jgi:hypothetical protein
MKSIHPRLTVVDLDGVHTENAELPSIANHQAPRRPLVHADELAPSGMPNWRHIAFFGRIPGKDPTARKAALDAARNELIPGGIAAWTAESAAIHSIETYPRVENAGQLFELALR